MNIIEFLDEVGHTNLKHQYLHECVQGAVQRRGHTQVKFGTTEITPNDLLNPQRIGVIVWMDREHFERAQAKL